MNIDIDNNSLDTIYELINLCLKNNNKDNNQILIEKIDKLISSNIYKLDKIKNAEIEYILGAYYHHIKYEYSLAEKYYKLSADKKHKGAINNLGVFYSDIKKNPDLAIEYYLMIEEYDIVKYNLGLLYIQNKEYKKGVDYLKLYIKNTKCDINKEFPSTLVEFLKKLDENFKEIKSDEKCNICYIINSNIYCKQCKNKYCFNCVCELMMDDKECTTCKR